MSTLDAFSTIPFKECTKLPEDEPPNWRTLKTLRQQINANAMAIPSTLGGGH